MNWIQVRIVASPLLSFWLNERIDWGWQWRLRGGYEFLVKNVFENDFKSLICLVICTQNLVSWIFHHMKTFRKFWYIPNYGMNDGNLSFHSEKCRDTFPLCCETFPDCGVPDFTATYRRWLEGMRMLEGIDARTEMDQRQLRDLLNTWVTCGK